MRGQQNREQSQASVVEMDARTLLRTINSGALSQFKIFEDKIRQLGENQELNLSLVSLNSDSLIYEDVDSGNFYQADIRKNGRRIRIENARRIKVVESVKKGMLSKVCNELVDAISEDDQKNTEIAFSKIAKHGFRSKVIPSSGWITARDGVARYIPVSGEVVSDDLKPKIIATITEALSDTVKITRGRIIESSFSDGEDRLVIPITEMTRRKVVARHMQEAAKDAYKSEGFQKRINKIAGYVSKNKLVEGVKVAMKFLAEEQEFCLLSLSEMRNLVSDTLASAGIFNESLAKDVGTLFYRTSCKVNKEDILEHWRKTAQKAENSALIENVRILEESEVFEEDYQKFLGMIFNEDSSTKDVRAQAYLTSLEQIRKVIEGVGDEDTLGSIDDYISRLRQDPENIDDATLYEVEDLLASISHELIQDVRSLADYDEIPEVPDDSEQEFGSQDLSGEAGAGGPAVPLPITGLEEPGAIPGEPAPEAGVPGALPGPGAEGGPAPAVPLQAPGLMAADVNRADDAILEGLPEHLKKFTFKKKGKKGKKDDDGGGEDKDDSDGGDDDSGDDSSAPPFEGKLVRNMTVEDLNKELGAWRRNGEFFFAANGLDVCSEALRKYVDRAIDLEDKGLVEGFEKVLSHNLLPEDSDPYALDLEEDFGMDYGEEVDPGYGGIGEMVACEACGSEMMASECMESGYACSECGSPMEYAVAEEAVGMDSPDGKGIVSRGLTKSDGKSSSGGSKDTMDQSGGGVAKDSSSKEYSGKSGEVASEDTTPSNYGGTGLKMGGQDGKGIAKKGMKKVSGLDASGGPGGEASGDKMDKKGGTGVAGSGTKKSDGKSGGTSSSSGGNMGDSDAGASKSKTPGGYGGTGLDMGGQDGKGVAAKGLESSDGVSSSKKGPAGAVGEDVESDEEVVEEGKLKCGCTPGSCKNNKECKCGPDCPCKGGEVEEAQYKHGTKRQPRGFKRSNLSSEDIDNAVASIANLMEEDDDIVAQADEEETVEEDNDVTQPTSSKYDSDSDSRNDGDGKKRRPLPSFSQKDYEGSGDVKTGDKSSGSGHPKSGGDPTKGSIK